MAKKQKKVEKPKLNLTKLKKDILKKYVELKKENKDPNYKVPRTYFEKESGFTRHFVESTFNNYTTLVEEGYAEYYKKLPKSHRALLSEKIKKFDNSASKEDCIEDLRKVAESVTLGSISRDYYREHGKYSDSTWNAFFGTFQEFRRQANLELTRHQHKLERSIAKHAAHDHYKDYIDSELLPFYKKYVKPQSRSIFKKIIVLSDLHDKECDEFTLSVFIAECIRKQPDVIALNGDIFDLYEFSSYTKDPREYDILGRFQYVWDNVFAPLRKGCPRAQIDFIIGNHEFRLIKLLADATPNIRVLMADVMGLRLKDVFKLDDYQINLVSKFDLGAYTTKDINNELKRNYQIYYSCYVICHEPDKSLMIMSGTNGHHHRLSHESGAYPNPVSGEAHQVTWVQTPAGHRKNAEYIQNLCKWNTGFLEVCINTETKEVVQKIHQTFNTWTEIDGIIYKRNRYE